MLAAWERLEREAAGRLASSMNRKQLGVVAQCVEVLRAAGFAGRSGAAPVAVARKLAGATASDGEIRHP